LTYGEINALVGAHNREQKEKAKANKKHKGKKR